MRSAAGIKTGHLLLQKSDLAFLNATQGWGQRNSGCRCGRAWWPRGDPLRRGLLQRVRASRAPSGAGEGRTGEGTDASVRDVWRTRAQSHRAPPSHHVSAAPHHTTLLLITGGDRSTSDFPNPAMPIPWELAHTHPPRHFTSPPQVLEMHHLPHCASAPQPDNNTNLVPTQEAQHGAPVCRSRSRESGGSRFPPTPSRFPPTPMLEPLHIQLASKFQRFEQKSVNSRRTTQSANRGLVARSGVRRRSPYAVNRQLCRRHHATTAPPLTQRTRTRTPFYP